MAPAACRRSAARCAAWRGCCAAIRPRPSATLWQALVNDRRFAGRGFKRQTPVGQHICDFVSFPLRLVIDLVPADEGAAAAKARADKRAWLAAARLCGRRSACRRHRRPILPATCSIGSARSSRYASALEHLDRRRRAGAQHRQIAHHGEELTPRLASADGALGRMAIGAGNFLGLLRGGDDAVELALDVLRQRVEPACRPTARSTRSEGPRNRPSMPGVSTMASKFFSAVRVSIMASVTT